VFIGTFVDAIDIDERIKSSVAASMSQRDKQERNQEHHPFFSGLVCLLETGSVRHMGPCPDWRPTQSIDLIILNDILQVQPWEFIKKIP